MDPALNPYLPDACGTWDGAAAASAACGAAMEPLCSGGYADPVTGVLRSPLVSSVSNCANWRYNVQLATAVGAPAPAQANLDAAMNAYCLGIGSLTAECGCLAFPVLAKPWCDVGSLSCPNYPASQCAAREFAQVDAESQLQVVQFTTCNPQECWNAACQANPQDVLLTSAVLSVQSTQGACAGVCGQFVGESTINIPPMPPNSFNVAASVVNQSQIGSCGSKTAPALLTAVPETWHFAANGVMAAPLFVTNDGDYPAAVTVAGSSLGPVCALEPANNVVYGRSSQQFAVVCDQPTVAAWYAASASYDPHTDPYGPASLTLDAMFSLSYEDYTTGLTVVTAPLGITAVVGPVTGPIVETQTVVPAWFWITLAAAILLLVLVQFVLIRRTKARIVDMLTSLQQVQTSQFARAR